MTRLLTVILLSGSIGAGKTLLAENLARMRGADHLRTSALIAASPGAGARRLDLQRAGLEPSFQQGEWLARALAERVAAAPADLFLLDSVRTIDQVQACRTSLDEPHRIVHVHLTARAGLLAERFTRRLREEDTGLSCQQAMRSPSEAAVARLAETADFIVDTTSLTPADVAVRVAAYARPPGSRRPHVDVLVGGQWGSEGKGNIAFALAPEYDLLVRAGAPNAGHRVRSRDGNVYTHCHLSSGTRATGAPVLLGAGVVLNVSVLLQEISDCGLSPERLTIDPRALIIEDEDIRRETGLKESIGSTGTGGGAAVARRIMARDRTLLADVGIPPQSVRHVITVFRTCPIRVGGPSGPMGREITWQNVADRSGIPLGELLSLERESVSHSQRRVAEFDWAQLVSAVRLNGTTDVALTFADYLDAHNRQASRADQLTPETLRFMEDIEAVTRLPVSFISANFDSRGPIDRRRW